MRGENKDLQECSLQKFAFRQGVVLLPVTGLKIVHKLDSPAFSTLMLLPACGGTCESAVAAVTRRCSVAIQYNGSAIFVRSCDLLRRAVELCRGDFPVAAAVFLRDHDKDTFLQYKCSQFEPNDQDCKSVF